MRIAGVMRRDSSQPVPPLPAEGLVELTWPGEKPQVRMVVRGDDPGIATATLGDRSFIVLDGYLYAHREIEGLPGADPADRLLRALRIRGTTVLPGLDGDAAVSYWDAERQELVLWRSEIPPVFYALRDDLVLWSTDLKTLLRLGVHRQLDLLAVDAYLATGWVPAPWTFFTAIRKLPARHAIVVRDGQIHFRSTRDLQWNPKLGHDAAERAQNLLAAVEISVRRRTRGERRIGVLVSGGVDSSVVLAVAARWGDMEVEAFTYRYEDYEGPLNEGWAARELAEFLGVPHHEIPVSPAWLADNLHDLLWAYEEPFTHGLHSARLDRVAGQGNRVVLTGMGAGAWYPSRKHALVFSLARMPRAIVAAMGATGELLYDLSWRLPSRRVRSALRLASDPLRLASVPVSELSYRHLQLGIRSARVDLDRARAALYRDADLSRRGRAALLALIEERLEGAGNLEPPDQRAFLAVALTDPDELLMWGHRWGGIAVVSVRAPFFGLPVVDYLARVERKASNKEEFRRAAKQLIPAHIANRPKFPQSIPIDQWLRGPLRDLVTSYLTRRRLDDAEIFDTDAVLRLVDEHLRGVVNHKWVLWTMLSFIVWKELFLDAPVKSFQGEHAGVASVTRSI